MNNYLCRYFSEHSLNVYGSLSIAINILSPYLTYVTAYTNWSLSRLGVIVMVITQHFKYLWCSLHVTPQSNVYLCDSLSKSWALRICNTESTAKKGGGTHTRQNWVAVAAGDANELFVSNIQIYQKSNSNIDEGSRFVDTLMTNWEHGTSTEFYFWTLEGVQFHVQKYTSKSRQNFTFICSLVG